MRDFSWKYFTMTGDVDAFMLYKEMDQLADAAEGSEEEPENDEAEGAGL
ncbi:YqzL family protein [Paenibacillus humicola]|nr:YqzL family protein [Paenibacillus humicola]